MTGPQLDIPEEERINSTASMVSSATGHLAAARQIMPDISHRGQGLLPADYSHMDDIIAHLATLTLPAGATQFTEEQAALIRLLFSHMSYRTGSDPQLNDPDIELASLTAPEFSVNMPYAAHLIANDNVALAVDLFGQSAANVAPIQNDNLAAVALRTELTVTDNRAGANENWKRIGRMTFEIQAHNQGAFGLLDLGVRGQANSRTNIILLNTNANGVHRIAYSTGGNTVNFAAPGSDVTLATNDIVDLGFYFHRTPLSGDESAASLIIIAVAIVYRNGNYLKTLIFNDSDASYHGTGLGVNLAWFDFHVVKFFGGNAAQTTRLPMANIETWTYAPATDPQRLPHHTEFAARVRSRPSELARINGHYQYLPIQFWQLLGGWSVREATVTDNAKINEVKRLDGTEVISSDGDGTLNSLTVTDPALTFSAPTEADAEATESFNLEKHMPLWVREANNTDSNPVTSVFLPDDYLERKFIKVRGITTGSGSDTTPFNSHPTRRLAANTRSFRLAGNTDFTFIDLGSSQPENQRYRITATAANTILDVILTDSP